jgi:hypothetical protein
MSLPRYSLSTVVRACLLEHVIALRRSPRAWMLRRFARWIFPENNFMGHALGDQALPWARG